MIFPLIAFIAVFVLVPLLAPLAQRFGLTDQPGGRKIHDGAVPLIGGVTIIPVFAAISFVGGLSLLALWPFFTALFLIMMAGFLDDRFYVAAWPKFFVHITAALLIIIPGGAQIESLGNLAGFGDFDLGYAAIPFTLAAVVLLVNAVNLIDGVDGMAGGTVFVMLGWLAFAGGASAMPELLILMGALAGFLVHNMRSPFCSKARAFLGDAGSLSLGLALAWFAIAAVQPEGTGLEAIAIAWIMAHPIYDVCAQFYRRVREGRHPFDADRGHFHHHFITAGVSPGKTTFIILMLNAAFGAIGVLGAAYSVPLPLLTITWTAGLLAHMALSRKPEIYISLFRKLA